MAIRRTTMRSRSGTKLYAVRDSSGKFKDIQTYKRAHAADLRHKSKAEKEAAQGPMEKKVRKAAKGAVKSVKRSVRGAVAAVGRAAKRAVRQVSNLRPTGTQPTGKKTAKKASKKSARRPAVKIREDREAGSEEDLPQARREKDCEEGRKEEVRETRADTTSRRCHCRALPQPCRRAVSDPCGQRRPEFR